MPKTIERTVYQFGELSDAAKEKARDWWREISADDNDFADATIADAIDAAAMLGIEIAHDSRKLKSGREVRDPRIYWSLFVQGSGASFEGSYAYKPGAAKAVRADRPQDTDLHAIADALQRIQARHFYKLTASVKTSGGVASYCMEVETDGGECSVSETADREITKALRDFGDLIYRDLQAAAEDAASNEYIDETLEANEYEFLADGTRFRH